MPDDPLCWELNREGKMSGTDRAAESNDIESGGPSKKRTDGPTTFSWFNAFTLSALALLVVHLLLRYGPTLGGGDWPKDGGIDSVGLALAVFAALPILVPVVAPHLTSAKLPGGIEFAFRQVQRRQDLNEAAINQLRFIVDGFLTHPEYEHLLNISANKPYRVEDHEVSTLTAELRRLIALGMIERRQGHLGVRSIAVADGQYRKVGDYFRLTPRGLEYLAMRAENERVATV